MKPTKKPASPTAREIVVADAVPLDGAQRKVLAEALRRAEDTRNVMEDALVAFGRWLLVQVFDDDAGAALVTPRRVVAQVRGFREKVTQAQWQRRAVNALNDGDDDAREAARKELEALRSWAKTLLDKLAK